MKIELPEMRGREITGLKRRMQELASFEVKRQLLIEFVDEVMEGSKQLSEKELVKLGRKIKKGRFEQLKKEGWM